MAWVTPTDVDPGDAILASLYNQDVVANTAAIRAAQVNVKSTTKTDTFTAVVAAGGEAEITDLNVTITPTAATSKILIVCHVSGGGDTTGGVRLAFRLKRDSTAIGLPAASGNRQRVTSVTISGDGGGSITGTAGMFLDNPNTTSPITYRVFTVASSGSSQTHYINRTRDNSDLASILLSTSSITAIEVPV